MAMKTLLCALFVHTSPSGNASVFVLSSVKLHTYSIIYTLYSTMAAYKRWQPFFIQCYPLVLISPFPTHFSLVYVSWTCLPSSYEPMGDPDVSFFTFIFSHSFAERKGKQHIDVSYNQSSSRRCSPFLSSLVLYTLTSLHFTSQLVVVGTNNRFHLYSCVVFHSLMFHY